MTPEAMATAKARQIPAAYAPPPLPPRRDESSASINMHSGLQRGSSVTSLRIPPSLSQAALNIRTSGLNSPTAVSPATNATQTNLPQDDAALDDGIAAGQSPMALDQRWMLKPLQFSTQRMGVIVNLQVEGQIEPATPSYPQPSPISPRGMPSRDNALSKSSILGKLSSIVGKKNSSTSPISPFARLSAPPSVAFPSIRKTFVQTQGVVYLEAVWIPGKFQHGPVDIAEADLWLGRLSSGSKTQVDKVALNGVWVEKAAGDHYGVGDANGEAVPDWARFVALLKKHSVA